MACSAGPLHVYVTFSRIEEGQFESNTFSWETLYQLNYQFKCMLPIG
ncbi:hypothetical protein SLEP1_g33051 [Rubroshorea leprosula]|uniref:Uncharacterized protein n=1 Tax=Rubroshorea leprosula TaxID=152421 RepID=A0AAV5KFD4_9ROSI|nr:hypothetical protein SLEP1_g33051 [Rubroshorea leprosula]